MRLIQAKLLFRTLVGGMAFLWPLTAPAGDVQFYTVMKGTVSVQADAALPALQGKGPFALRAVVERGSSIGLTQAVVQVPGGLTVALETNRSGFSLVAEYESQALLDAAYPDGTYTLNMQTISGGTKAAPLGVRPSGVPSPHVSNWAAAQTIHAEADFLLQWDSLTPDTSADWIKLIVRDFTNHVVFETADPVISGQAGLLRGTNSSVVIPGETLVPGRSYSAELIFAKGEANTASYPGVVGMGASFKSTQFTLQAVDVRNYGILKGQLFHQTGPTNLVPVGFVLDAFVNFSSLFGLGLGEARFRPPGPRTLFQPLPPPDFYVEEGPYPTAAELNAAFPNGTYFLAFKAGREGSKTPSVSVTGDAYPTATPLLRNYAALQTFNAGADFTLTWAPLGGGSDDFVHVEIVQASTNLTVWETPQEGELGALNGTNTSVVIPAGSLRSGSNYLLYLTSEKPTLNTTGVPGVPGIAGYYKQTICPLRSMDVFGYGILKSQVYLQTNSGPPALQGYAFSAFVDVEPGTTNLSRATLQLPSAGRTYELNAGNRFDVEELFSEKAQLEAQFVSGNYLFSHSTVHDGVIVVTTLLPADRYPAAVPRMANFDAAQTINCGADFPLAWQPLNSSTDHFVWVTVDEASSGETVFSSPWVGNAGALNGTHTSVVIPAKTLRAGYSYRVTILHAALALDISSYPGALGLTGYDTQTQFEFTVPGIPFPKRVQIVGLNDGQFQLKVVGEPGRTNILESATSLAPASWAPVTTNLGAFNFSDALQLPTRFYRLREATAVGP